MKRHNPLTAVVDADADFNILDMLKEGEQLMSLTHMRLIFNVRSRTEPHPSMPNIDRWCRERGYEYWPDPRGYRNAMCATHRLEEFREAALATFDLHSIKIQNQFMAVVTYDAQGQRISVTDVGSYLALNRP